MRETPYSFAKIFDRNQVKELNIAIKENLLKGEDGFAAGTQKTSEVKFLRFGKISKYIAPFIDFCYYSNINYFGFDLHPLTSQQRLNYNIYEKGTEYSWHIDSAAKNPVKDIKLTALVNLSEESYEGGELVLFKTWEIICKEFNEPGAAIIFPSFTNHKVNKIISGSRNTLALWMSGPKFR
jgi:PKHD-type hydroxylase